MIKMIKTNDDMMAVMNNQHMDSNVFQQRPPQVTRSNMDYELEGNRLASFVNHWPNGAPLTPQELAAAGFYYTGPGDRVQCAWCRGGLYNWEAGDIAISEHKKHFPKCPFIERKLEEMMGIGRKSRDLSDVSEHQQKDNYQQKSGKAIEIVKQMGYDEDTVNKAVQKVKNEWCKTVTSSNLIDAIYEIEADEQKLPVPSGACNIENDSKMQSNESPFNCAVGPEKEASYSDSISMYSKHAAPNSTCNRDSDHTMLLNEPPSSHNEKTPSNSHCSKVPIASNIHKAQNSLFSNTDEKVQALCDENKRLKDSKTCKICLDNEVNMLFLPCRHLVCCEQCGDSVRYCPVCRTEIVATVKTYLG